MMKLAKKSAETGIGTIPRSCVLDVSRFPYKSYLPQVKDMFLSYVCISEAHVPWQYVFSYGSTTDAPDYPDLATLVRHSSVERTSSRA